jgi:hypothetical protein
VAEGVARAGDRARDDRAFRFVAMPPPGSGVPLTAGDGISKVNVVLRGTQSHGEFSVEGLGVVSVDRRELRAWLAIPPRKAIADFRQPPLILRRSDGVVYFQLKGHTAPMILTARAIKLMQHVLRD